MLTLQAVAMAAGTAVVLAVGAAAFFAIAVHMYGRRAPSWVPVTSVAIALANIPMTLAVTAKRSRSWIATSAATLAAAALVYLQIWVFLIITAGFGLTGGFP